MRLWNVWLKDDIVGTLLVTRNVTGYELGQHLQRFGFPPGSWAMED